MPWFFFLIGKSGNSTPELCGKSNHMTSKVSFNPEILNLGMTLRFPVNLREEVKREKIVIQ